METLVENLLNAFVTMFNKSVALSQKNNVYSLFDLWSNGYSFIQSKLNYKRSFKALCSILETILLGTNVYEVFVKNGGYTDKFRWFHNFLHDNPENSIIKHIYSTRHNIIPLFSNDILEDKIQIAVYLTKESIGKRFLISFDTLDLKNPFVNVEEYIRTNNPTNLFINYHELVYELFEDFVCDNQNWGDNTIMIDRPAKYSLNTDFDILERSGHINDRDRGQFILSNVKYD